MNTTVVAQSAIGALSALIGGLGGAAIATRPQRSNEQRRQRERAAEVLGLVWPLLSELNPDPILTSITRVEPGQQDPMIERFAKLDERIQVAGEQLSTLQGWWSTPKGWQLARSLMLAIYDLRYWDVWAVKDLRNDKDFRDARRQAGWAWRHALALAEELQWEIRGEVAPTPPKRLLLPAHPESWTGPAPTGLLQRWLSG